MIDASDLERRPLRQEDAPAVLRLVNGYDEQFLGEGLTDLEDIVAEWQVPAFDLDRDTLSLWHESELVASAELGPRGRVEVVVDPGWRQRGLEVELLAELETRARARAFAAVDRFVPEGDHAGVALLRGRGYQLHHTSWVLRLDADAPVASRELPPGYQVRPFQEADASAAFGVISAAFGEWESGPTRSFGDWEAEFLRRPGADLGTFRVATSEGRVVGVCVVVDGPEEAWVSQLAVDREHRGRGVAQQLLAETYRAARERGLAAGGLSTDTRTGALDLYLRLGMRVRHTIQNWSLALDRPA